MALTLFYITNNPEIAKIAQKNGVKRIFVDLEVIGKEERQKNMNTVKSKHSVEDVKRIAEVLSDSELLVRVNPWNEESKYEIEEVIAAGANIIMLPYWKTAQEVESFLSAIKGRTKATLLLETKEAVGCIDEVLQLDFDEIHIGLNDLHLSYGLTFMFELLSDGTVELLCDKFKKKGIPYGFGGIAKLGEGLLPAEKIIMEHYRLGSTRAILSRAFCDVTKVNSIEKIEDIFSSNMKILRTYERELLNMSDKEFAENKAEVKMCVDNIVEKIKR